MIIGPVTAETRRDQVEEKHARVLMSPDLLGIGLDASCRMMIRLHSAPKAEVAASPPLTPAEQRSAMGFFPALLTFFQTIQSTPGMRDVLWNVIEKPSLWSIARHKGRIDLSLNVGNGISLAAGKDWTGITKAETFVMPVDVKLNDQPALEAELFVTTPRPPLLTAAGIIGLRAKSPTHADRTVTIRMIATGRRPP